jgi:hypothetical protein
VKEERTLVLLCESIKNMFCPSCFPQTNHLDSVRKNASDVKKKVEKELILQHEKITLIFKNKTRAQTDFRRDGSFKHICLLNL